MRASLRRTLLPLLLIATDAVAAPKAEQSKPPAPLPRDDCSEFPVDTTPKPVRPLSEPKNEDADPLGGVRRTKVDESFEDLLSRRHFPDGGLVQPSEWNRPTDGGLPDHLDKVAIFGVVVSHKDEIKRCVKLQKESAPERTGTAVMHWVVQGNGDVRDVECATAETENTVMDKCMRSIVSRWKFPTSRCGQVVDFPFKF